MDELNKTLRGFFSSLNNRKSKLKAVLGGEMGDCLNDNLVPNSPLFYDNWNI